MSRTLITLAGLLLMAGDCVGADGKDQSLTTYRDFSIAEERDRPIQCKPGDVEQFPGKTMAQVFGDAWPAQPTPQTSESHSPAELLQPGTLVPPVGVESQSGLVTVAALVDQHGRVLRVEPVCMTAAVYARAAKRAARTARYTPAVIDGLPVTSVVMQVYVFKPQQENAPRAKKR